MDIDHKILSTAILPLLLIKKGNCQLQAKVCALSSVNRIGGLNLCRDSVSGLTDCLPLYDFNSVAAA